MKGEPVMDFMEATRIDVASLKWEPFVSVPKDRVLAGQPETSTLLLVEAEDKQMRLWKVTPGAFATDHSGYIEYIQILDGAGRLVSETGTVTELRAGVNVVMPVGWRGRWEIDVPLTKVFTIVQGGSNDFTIHLKE